MKNPFDDDRFMFGFTFSLAILMLWQSGFGTNSPTVFWTVVIISALIFVLGMRIQKRILKGDTWSKAVESDKFTRRVAIQFYLVLLVVVFSPLVLSIVASDVIGGFESIALSGLIGLAFGVDLSIIHNWLKFYKR